MHESAAVSQRMLYHFLFPSPAICLPPCENGVCDRPDNCTCEPGWTDERCRIGTYSMFLMRVQLQAGCLGDAGIPSLLAPIREQKVH